MQQGGSARVEQRRAMTVQQLVLSRSPERAAARRAQPASLVTPTFRVALCALRAHSLARRLHLVQPATEPESFQSPPTLGRATAALPEQGRSH